MQICLFSVANTFIVFAFKYPQNLTIYGHVVGNLNFLNYFAPFYLIEMRFSPEIIEFYEENYY